MNEVIKKAVEGGYEPFKTLHMKYCKQVHYMDNQIVVQPGSGGMAIKLYLEITQDSLFWSCLGKSLGWEEDFEDEHGEIQMNGEWLAIALDYFELLLTNGDTEKFWSDLIKK